MGEVLDFYRTENYLLAGYVGHSGQHETADNSELTVALSYFGLLD